MGKKQPESEIERRQREIGRRKRSALSALGEYLQYRENLDILLRLSSPEVEDIIWGLTPRGALPKISRRLKSAGVTHQEFVDKVGAVLNLAQDKMIQPPTRQVITTKLWSVFSEARKK